MTVGPGWVPARRLLPWLPQSPYLVDHRETERLRSEARSVGFEIGYADLSEVKSERELLQALGAALGFPDYYHPNWDAFDDCVGDLSRASAAPIALLAEHADHLLTADVHAFVRSVHLLASVVETLEQGGGAFRLEVFFLGAWDAISA